MAFADLVAATDGATRKHLGSVSVLYTPTAGAPPLAPVTVTGLFDDNTVLLDDGPAGAEQLGPAVFLRLSELPTDPDVDSPTLTIGGHVYKIHERLRDGMGGIRLLLHLVA